ncbi:hypothetical protein [Methylobacterium haplocladii]|nr:hypothetical protein [Methylobacterium haplocladii]
MTTDGLQILPEYYYLWQACLQALLSELGPGQYIYGNNFSIEPPRESQIAMLSGTAVQSVCSYTVAGVKFSQWDSWETYERDLCHNVRRNLRKAREKYPDAIVETRWGLSSFNLVPSVLKAKSVMYKRKNVSSSKIFTTTGLFLRPIFIKKNSFCSILRSNNETLSAFSGVEIGNLLYYIEGGSIESPGVGWMLKISLMKNFYNRFPSGVFIMGTEMRSGAFQSDTWKSFSRYRRDARVSGFPTSVVTFQYY